MMRVRLLACGPLALASFVVSVLGVLVLGAGCGPKVPQHAGYKTKSPWKKAKPIKLENGEGKAKGTLDYADYKRAKWYTLDLPEDGDLNLSLSFSPTDDAGAATVAMEVLDAGYNVISEDEDAPLVARDDGDGEDGEDEDGEDEEDEEEEEDSGDDESENTQKTRALDSLTPGRYYVHLFVTKRLDAAEFELLLAYTPVPVQPKTNFPKNVAFVSALPTVPVADDAPVAIVQPEPDKPKPCKPKGSKKCKKPPKPPKPPVITTTTTPTTTVTADVVAVDAGAGGSGSDITVNAGTNDGLTVGRKGKLSGVKNGSFLLTSCSANACKAHVKASPEEVKKSSMTVKIP